MHLRRKLINCNRVINILNSFIKIRTYYLVCSTLEEIIRSLILFSLLSFINNLAVTNIVHMNLGRNWKGDRFFFFHLLEVSALLLTSTNLLRLPDFINLLFCYIFTSFNFICCKSFIFSQKKVVRYIK